MTKSERAVRDRARYAAAPEKYRAKARAYVARNREARAAYSRSYRDANPEKVASAKAAHRAAFPERGASYARTYRARNPEKHKETFARQNLKKYGLTPESKRAMVESQGGRCAICSDALRAGRGTHVDHCHATGKVRGILCHGCNLMIGYAKDNTMTLQFAIQYLQSASGIFTFSGAAID